MNNERIRRFCGVVLGLIICLSLANGLAVHAQRRSKSKRAVQTRGLSRSNAAALISKNASFPKTWETLYSGRNNQDDNQGEHFLQGMKSQGYIDSDGKYTPKGEAAKVNWRKRTFSASPSYENWYVPCGERELIEVTGISETQISMAEATFTWHWKPNEIGKAIDLGKETYTGRAVFQKFDDGWRVQRLTF
jgi:hypothetical protein